METSSPSSTRASASCCASFRELGVDDETLVVFTSDNGPWLLWVTDRPVPQGGQDGGSAGPLREGKSSTFEGGMRVPSCPLLFRESWI